MASTGRTEEVHTSRVCSRGADRARLNPSLRCAGITGDSSSVSKMGRIMAKSSAMGPALSRVALERCVTSPLASSLMRSSSHVTLHACQSVSAQQF